MTITATITTVTEQLQQEESLLKEQIEQHQSDLATLQQDLARLQTAIKALTGNGKKTARKQKRGNSKPAPTQPEVSKAVSLALTEAKSLTAEQVTERVEQATTKAGKSRVGLSLRIKQALQSDTIKKQPDGHYCLK